MHNRNNTKWTPVPLYILNELNMVMIKTIVHTVGRVQCELVSTASKGDLS